MVAEGWDSVVAACYDDSTMTIWFTSDLHFGHGNIIKYCDRPFVDAGGNPDVPHMNTALMNNWNERVAPDDTVMILGDIVMGQREKTLPLLPLLHGEKFLIMGNHDYCWPPLWKASQAAKAEKWTNAYAPYFADMGVEGYHTFYPASGDPITVKLHHFPYTGDSEEEDRYPDVRPPDNGQILLHGHIHDLWKTKKSPKGTLMVNVGSDVWDYAPVAEEELLALILEEKKS